MNWRWLSLTAVLLLAAAMAIGYHHFKTTADAGLPPLEIIDREINLGTVLLGEDRDFEATVRNNSDERLQINQIRSTCGCTNARVGKNDLKPGESTELRGTLRAKQTAGPFRHQIMLTTQSPRPLRAICSISGEVERRIRVLRERLALRPDFLDHRPDSQKLLVQNTSAQVVDVAVPNRLPDGVEIELDGRTIAPGTSRPLTVTVAPDVLVRRDVNFTLRCSHPLERSLPLAVEVRPVAEVRVSPRVVRIGVLSRRDLLAMGPIEVNLEAEPLAASELVRVALPSYLRESGNNGEGQAKRRSVFAFQDVFRGADLSDAIVMEFRHRKSGRLFQVRVTVSGFLRDYRES